MKGFGQQHLGALRSLNRVRLFGSPDKLDQLHIVGPLTMDKVGNRVYIVPDTELSFSPNAFETLYTLAIRENIALTFEQLYDSLWDIGDGKCRREEAHAAIAKVIERINAAGNGFVWIEENPATGYTFRTMWGHNRETWQQ